MATLTDEEAKQKLSEVLGPHHGSRTIFQPFGFRLPELFVTPESIAAVASLQLDPTDVWIAPYSKCGTTWVQNIVKLIRSNGEKDGVELQCSVPWAESNHVLNPLPTSLADMPKPRAFKSHMPYHHMPAGLPSSTPCKYIYVMRNPKDAAVSLYSFHLRMVTFEPGATLDWDLFLRNYMIGNMVFGSYFDNVLSWWPHRNDDNVLFLTFEDMKKDLSTAVSKIAKFIGAEISDEVLAKVVHECSFDVMKKDNTANWSFSDPFAAPGAPQFMRKGEVGDWKNYFTDEQSAAMDKLCEEKFKGTGIVLDFGL